MKLNLRRTFLNIYSLRKFYLPLFLLCLICSIVGIFVIELLQGALLLKDISYLPYTDYYLWSHNSNENNAASKGSTYIPSAESGSMIFWLGFYENVKDTMITELCSANADLYYFKKDMSISSKESGSFPWTVVPDSAFDDAFRDAERFLVEGRHLVRGDLNAALLDVELAKINNIHVGDSITSSAGDVYSVVGLYQTLVIDPVIVSAIDVPNNMIFVSNKPSDAKTISTYNLYISFAYPYSASEINRFTNQLVQNMGDDWNKTYSLTSVDQLNKDSNRGVLSMLRLSVSCVILMCVMIMIALYSFISSFYRKRQREFILYLALGKKRTRIIFDFCRELMFIILPSSVLGIVICNGFFLRYLKNIISYFEKLVSIESIFATSTLSLSKAESMSLGLYDQLRLNFTPDSIIFLLFFFFATFLCLIMISRASTKWSVMKMLSEK